jgi:hypothetical protein
MIRIYADSRRMGVCRSCGAAVEWATVVNTGSSLPFNPPIVATSAQPNLLDGGDRIEATATASHFLTCPQADAWRKRHGARKAGA